MMRTLSAAMLALTTAGCASHSLPSLDNFAAVSGRPQPARIFLDINGDFYPAGWDGDDGVGRKAVARHRSLWMATAGNPKLREGLLADRSRQLDEIAATVAGKRRVFVITHGFNTSDIEAAVGMAKVTRHLPLTGADAVIHLYWDGQLGSGVGAGKIWFSAVSNSQVVGSRGLRPILNLMRDQDVYLISHSRGASVMLSALANPPYSPSFSRATAKLSLPADLMNPPPLDDRGNRIRLVMLAPAIGFPDFWAKSCGDRTKDRSCTDPPSEAVPGQCSEYRDFGPQLRSIRYTLNQRDQVLKKYVGNLRRHFNATDLGVTGKVGQALARCYGSSMLTGRNIYKTDKHAFLHYADDPEVVGLIQEAVAEQR